MNTNTVNIAFKKDLLSQIDKIAREESRSRSELIREAARLYIERKSTWRKIFDYGAALTKTKNISENDIFAEIYKYRKSKRK